MSNPDEEKQNSPEAEATEEVAQEEVQTEKAETPTEEAAKSDTSDTEAEVADEEVAPETKETPIERTDDDFNVGDTVIVSNRIQEDNRTRVQKFEGLVIAKKGSGIGRTFTVRKIASNSIGVERIFPLHSPNITDIQVKRAGKTRRSKLYFLRERTGRAATYVKPG